MFSKDGVSYPSRWAAFPKRCSLHHAALLLHGGEGTGGDLCLQLWPSGYFSALSLLRRQVESGASCFGGAALEHVCVLVQHAEHIFVECDRLVRRFCLL